MLHQDRAGRAITGKKDGDGQDILEGDLLRREKGSWHMIERVEYSPKTCAFMMHLLYWECPDGTLLQPMDHESYGFLYGFDGKATVINDMWLEGKTIEEVKK